MSKESAEHHEKAAEHHEHAARHHREAAKHETSGNQEVAGHHAHVAHGHHLHASHHAEAAAKDHAAETILNKNFQEVNVEGGDQTPPLLSNERQITSESGSRSGELRLTSPIELPAPRSKWSPWLSCPAQNQPHSGTVLATS
jgi:hypothetical protein